MAKSEVIKSETLMDIFSSSYEATTFYLAALPNIIHSGVTQRNGIRNYVNYKEGDLLVDMNNYPNNVNSSLLLKKGEQVIQTNSGDSENYDVERISGDLLYKEDDSNN